MSKTISGYRGSLDLYYQVEDSSGNFGEVFDAGNVTNFDLTPDAEEIEIIDTGNANYGQAADSQIEAKPTKFSFDINRMNIDNWAVAFMGSVAARSAASAPVASEAVTAVLGGMVRLANLDVSSVVVKDVTDTTTYVLDTDYEIVDAALGIIKILSTGSIGDEDVLHVSYTKAAESGWLLSGGVNSSKFLRLFGRGINRFNNKRCIVQIPRGSVRPTSPFSFVGTEPTTLSFEGTINVPTDGSAAFTVVTDE